MDGPLLPPVSPNLPGAPNPGSKPSHRASKLLGRFKSGSQDRSVKPSAQSPLKQTGSEDSETNDFPGKQLQERGVEPVDLQQSFLSEMNELTKPHNGGFDKLKIQLKSLKQKTEQIVKHYRGLLNTLKKQKQPDC